MVGVVGSFDLWIDFKVAAGNTSKGSRAEVDSCTPTVHEECRGGTEYQFKALARNNLSA